MMRVYLDKASSIAYSLDASIRSADDLENRDSLFARIQKSIWLDPDLVSVSIYRPQLSGLVSTLASNPELVGIPAVAANLKAFREDRLITQALDNGFGSVLRVFSPIHVARKRIGTLRFDLTLENLARMQAEMLQSMLLGYLPLILITMLLLMPYIRGKILFPLLELGNGTRKIAPGQFRCARDG